MGAFPKKINKWRRNIDGRKVVGPRVITATSFITSRDGVPEMAPTLNFFEAFMAGGQFVERLSDPKKARQVGNRLVDQGANWLKTQYSEESFLFHGKLSNLSDECFKALRETADTREVGLTMHHTEIEGFKKGTQIGVDTLEHCATGLLNQKDIDSFIEKNMANELEHLTKAGFSDIETLKAATSVNADIIGMSDRVGSIERGKHADFTIVKGDPITEISAVRNIQYVVIDGVTVFDKHKSTES